MQSLALKAVVVYGSAFFIGLVLVSFPASSSFLKLTHGFSDQDYGAIFLPQLVLAIVGVLGAGLAVQKMSLKYMCICALTAFGLSQLSLCLYLSSEYALLMIMFATACFGFGFGGGPLNSLVCLLFPNKTGSACSAFFPVMVAVASEPYPQAVSWIASMLTAALMLGVGSYTIGSLKNIIPLEQIYVYSIIFPIASLVLIFISIRIRKVQQTG